jgi:hypothetical protein
MTAKWVFVGVINDRLSMTLGVCQALLYCSVLAWSGILARRSHTLARQLRVEFAATRHRARSK